MQHSSSRVGHKVARSNTHPDYPPRFAVPDDEVAWSSAFPGYAPVEFVADKVLANSCDRKPDGYADPDAPPPAAELKKRGSHEWQALGAPWKFDDSGRPLNPRGRTGLSNRGRLGKWGPNHAGDAIVTRYNREAADSPLEFVAIRRKDTGEWALPGGMVDAGEIAMAALRREFREEAADMPAAEQQRTHAILDELFADANGRVLYRGYVDDPRNTDNAWMETVAMHFHVPERIADALPLRAGAVSAMRASKTRPLPLQAIACR